MKKESKMRISILISIYTVLLPSWRCMQNFKTIGADKSVTEISIGEKEK